MSDYCSDPTYHVKRRGKIHWCSWCGENIEIGEKYAQWLYFDCRDRRTVYAHEECSEEWLRIAAMEGGIYTTFGDNPRPRSVAGA